MPQIRFPSTIVIPSGMKVHFGSQWVSTSGSAMHIQEFFISNWFNYTVDNAGTQNIYNDTQPDLVLIDGVERPITNGWNYAADTITVTGATSSCRIEWIVPSTPSTPPIWSPPQGQTSNTLKVLFKTKVGKTPAPQVEITVYEAAYNTYQDRYITDDNGEALASLPAGSYNWAANYRGAKMTGSFFHVEAQTVTIDFGSGTSQVGPTLDRAQLLKIGVGAIVVIGAVFAIVTVTKNKRFRI